MPDTKTFAKRLEDNQKIILQLQKNIDQMRTSFLDELSKDDSRKGDALIVSLKQQLDLTKDELVRTREDFNSVKRALEEKSALLDRMSAENQNIKSDIGEKSKSFLDKEAELSILKKRLAPIVEESKSLARSNANLLQELSFFKKELDEKEKQLHDKDSHFNLLIENMRNDAQRKLKEAIDMDSRTILGLRSEVEKLRIELDKRDALLREREVREKELMVEFVSKFKDLLEDKAPSNGLREILPLVDEAIKHGDSVEDIRSSLRRLGYKDDAISKAVSLIRKGI